jgi:hypothetical protein
MATSKTPKATPSARGSSDDRVRRDSAPTVRGERSISEDAARTNETGLVNDLSELHSLLASEFDQVALPTPPQIPGWHLCWLTTGSTYDSVQKRQRLGYIPVTAADVPGFETGGLASAQFEGALTCNEMVLFKIRSEHYNAIMKTFHHTRPLAEEESIYTRLQELTGEEDSSGRQLAKAEGDGFNQLGNNISRAKGAAPEFQP